MGKLIDADVFDGILKNAQEGCKRNGGNFRFGVLNSVRENLANLPAVDAAPVVHGRWRSIKAVGGPNYPYWDAKCSECGYTTKSTAGWLYCPHCGAKMDEKKENKT